MIFAILLFGYKYFEMKFCNNKNLIITSTKCSETQLKSIERGKFFPLRHRTLSPTITIELNYSNEFSNTLVGTSIDLSEMVLSRYFIWNVFRFIKMCFVFLYIYINFCFFAVSSSLDSVLFCFFFIVSFFFFFLILARYESCNEGALSVFKSTHLSFYFTEDMKQV